jgi:hypothetical protein
VAGVRLVHDAMGGPSQDAVEHADLLLVSAVAAQTSDHLDQEALLHDPLSPREVRIWANEDEVVTMHHASQVALRVVEATVARNPLDEPVLLQLRS